MPVLFVPHAKAAERFFEFFTANIRNMNTRRVQGRRGWVRLHDKGGKEMEAPCRRWRPGWVIAHRNLAPDRILIGRFGRPEEVGAADAS